MSTPHRFGLWVVLVGCALTFGAVQRAVAQTIPPLDARTWPRVFYDSRQRAEIVRKRLPPSLVQAEQAPIIDPDTLPPPTFTLDGFARGQQGASAIINNHWYRTGDKIFNWVVKIESNQVLLTGLGVPNLKLKPGQTVHTDTGVTSEPVPNRSLKFGATNSPAAPRSLP